jgi:hypothetical protein
VGGTSQNKKELVIVLCAVAWIKYCILFDSLFPGQVGIWKGSSK